MYDHGYEMMQTGGPGWIVMLAFWALLIVGIVFLVRYLLGANRSSTATPKAMEILEERFAKGEIDSKEFEEKRAVLSSRSEK